MNNYDINVKPEELKNYANMMKEKIRSGEDYEQ